MARIAKTIGMSFSKMFSRKNDTYSGLVRLFEIEYNKEYRTFRKNGVEIDDNFVRAYLNMR